jgi:hypothetical protein
MLQWRDFMPRNDRELAQHSTEQEFNKRIGFGRRSLRRALFISLGGFAIAFSLHIGLGMYPTAENPLHVLSEALLHLAIGFLVAAIVVWSIEYDAKRTTHKEILDFVNLVSKDVFQAVLERIVPDPVFTEIKNILLSDVIRSECEYRITLFKGQAPEGYFSIRRELGFTVENRLDRNVIFPVRSTHVGDDEAPISLDEAGSHFHLQLAVDKTEIRLEPNKNLFLRNGRIVLEHAHTLAPGNSVRIFLKGEERARIDAGHNSYLQGTQVVGMAVELKNECPDLIGVVDLQMNHPAGSEMKRNEFGRYFLDRAFLPGQGFYIIWRKVQSGQAK